MDQLPARQGSASGQIGAPQLQASLTRAVLDQAPHWQEVVRARLSGAPHQATPHSQPEAIEAEVLAAARGLLEQGRIVDLNALLAQWVQYRATPRHDDALPPEPLFGDAATPRDREPLFALMRALAPVVEQRAPVVRASLARSFAEMGATREAAALHAKIDLQDLRNPLARLDHAVCAVVLGLRNGSALMEQALEALFAARPRADTASPAAPVAGTAAHPAVTAVETLARTQFLLLEAGDYGPARAIAAALEAHAPENKRFFKSKTRRTLAAALYTRRFRAGLSLSWGLISSIRLPRFGRGRSASVPPARPDAQAPGLREMLLQAEVNSLQRDEPLSVLLARMAVQRWRIGVSKTLRHVKTAIKSRIFPEPAQAQLALATAEEARPRRSGPLADSEAIATGIAGADTQAQPWTVVRIWHALLSTFRNTSEHPTDEIGPVRAATSGLAQHGHTTWRAQLANLAGTRPRTTGWQDLRLDLAGRIAQLDPDTDAATLAGVLQALAQISFTPHSAPRAVALLAERLLDGGHYRLAADLSEPTSDNRIHKFKLLLNFLARHGDESAIDWPATLDRWWQGFEAAGGVDQPHRYMLLRTIWLETAQRMAARGQTDRAEAALARMCHALTGDSVAFMQRAQIADQRGDHRTAMMHWQMAATLAKRSNIQLGRYHIKPEQSANTLLTQANFGLRASRARFALQLRADGHEREFIELVSRILESTGTEATIQKDPELLDLLATYLRHALAPTHPAPVTIAPASTPRRIVICLDVLKFSDFHLHSRVIFTISRSLLDHYPDLQIRVIITNERLAITRPNIGSWMDFTGNEKTLAYARKTLADHYGTRFTMGFQPTHGLESLVRTCAEIIDFAPDVMLYAGGHGRYSNDSRIIRHTLFPYFPSALFFLGVDNEVDDKIDLIIPRGPHEIVGDPGSAAIRIQTYPTLPDGDERVKHPDEKPQPGFIVSALAGERFDNRLRSMAEADLRHLLGILDSNPDIVWHFVGAHDPRRLVADVPRLKPYTRQGRLVVHPIMELNAFREFVTDATLFVQLPGFKGGAGGAGMARRGGVPVLTFANSDVSGRQPPETVFEEGDVAGMAAFAARLLADPAEAARVTQSQFAYAEHIRETSVSGFFDCLVEAMALAPHRAARTMHHPARAVTPPEDDEDD